jgi:nucleoside-diphosphate-sugar epimerase
MQKGVLITGASLGIGLTIATLLAKRGHRVFIDRLSKYTNPLPEPIIERLVQIMMGVYHPRKDAPLFALFGGLALLMGWLGINLFSDNEE